MGGINAQPSHGHKRFSIDFVARVGEVNVFNKDYKGIMRVFLLKT